MTGKHWKWSAGILACLVAVVCIVLYAHRFPAPISEIARARINITKAETANSGRYDLPVLENAKALYDSAMTHWKQENTKAFFLRDFQKTSSYAHQASQLATTSLHQGRMMEANLATTVKGQVAALKAHLRHYENTYTSIPLDIYHHQDLAMARLLLLEGRQAFQKGDYLHAQVQLDRAGQLITAVSGHTREKLEKYFLDLPLWKKWAEKAISDSKKHKSTAIVVDKYARTCMLYKNGTLIGSYPSELGTNWMGDKQYQGDKATPEGNYKVVSKKAGPETKYFKALLLDYPNQLDKQRFLAGKKKGLLAQDAAIGGLIEIHGHGGKGTDWTDGCVALPDTSMEALFAQSPIGTTVTIVGSLKALPNLNYQSVSP